MLIDLLNSQNYIMVNMDAIRIFGLNTAIYCAELLNVYKKAYLKNKFVNDSKFFKVDRKFIEERTSLSVESQLACDINLMKPEAAVIQKDVEDPNIIYFDIERFASILADEDVKLQEKISKKVNIEKPKGVGKAKKDFIIQSLKDSVKCSNFELLKALHDWIDAICESDKGGLSKVQVTLFKETLDSYTKGDLDLALEIVRIATVHAWRDCQWAINTHEKDVKFQRSNSNTNINVRTTTQSKVDVNNLSSEGF